MIWIIVLSALVLYVILVMCLLIISSRADKRKEAIFTNRLADRNDSDVASSSSVPARPEYTQAYLLHTRFQKELSENQPIDPLIADDTVMVK
jgi:hypothetical protein